MQFNSKKRLSTGQDSNLHPSQSGQVTKDKRVITDFRHLNVRIDKSCLSEKEKREVLDMLYKSKR